MNYVLQINTGGFYHKKADFETIKSRLSYCFERLPVKAILIGWAIDRELYKKVCRYVDGRCDVYLWLPVFSEVNDVYDFEESIDFNGNKMQPIRIAEGENFLFVCPSSRDNINKVFQLYENNFSNCGFDGVFLDRIRSSTFANSYENGFGCFCPRCRTLYVNQGLNLKTCLDILNKREAEDFVPSDYSRCRYSFENEAIDRLFTIKAGMITSGVRALADRFKELGLKVGLDTFAPILSWYVGQDILSLSEFADFIKPMIYRISKEPAGISYEIEHLIDRLGVSNPERFRERMYHLIGSNNPAGSDAYLKQLGMLKDSFCDIYPGMEFNKKPGCDSNLEYVLNTVKLTAESHYDTLVLAWDILSAPIEHIDCLPR